MTSKELEHLTTLRRLLTLFAFLFGLALLMLILHSDASKREHAVWKSADLGHADTQLVDTAKSHN